MARSECIRDVPGDLFGARIDPCELGAVVETPLAQRLEHRGEVLLQGVKVGDEAVLIKLLARIADDDLPVVPVRLLAFAPEQQGVARVKGGFDQQFIHAGQYNRLNPAAGLADKHAAIGADGAPAQEASGMRIGEQEFGTRELNDFIARAAREWEKLPLEIETSVFRRLALRERLRADWPEEEALLRFRLARVRLVQDILTRLMHGNRVHLAEVREIVDELVGVLLDSPWRAAHLALVHTYRWAGPDDDRTGHDADGSVATRGPAALAEHAYSTALVSIGVATHLGWAAPDVRHAGLTALLQDVGTLLVPQRGRREEPDDAPFTSAWQRHTALSVYALRAIERLPDAVRRAVYQHHERLDGQGFPEHLPAGRISALARVTALADAYIAPLEAKRGTPPNLPTQSLLDLLAEAKSKCWERDDVRALARLVGLYPPGSIVKLDSGLRALVLATPASAPQRPIVLPFVSSNAENPEPIDLRRPECRALRIRSAEPRWLHRHLPQVGPTAAPLRASA